MIVTSHAIYAFRFKYFFSWFIVHFRSIDGFRLEDDASNEFFRIRVRNERGPLCEDRLRRHWTGPEASPLHASENITGRDNRRIHLHCGEILVPMFSSIPVSFYFSFIFHTDRDIFTRSNPTIAPTKWKIPKVSIRLDEPPCSKETIKQYRRSINRHGRKRNGSRKNWIWWASETGYFVFRGSSRCILKVTEC